MLLLRSSVIVYILAIFTLFNSRWSKMAIENVLITLESSQSSCDINPKSYKTVKAVQVSSKSCFKFFIDVRSGDFTAEISDRYREVLKIFSNFSSRSFHSFIISYLHLLQFF